MRSVFLMGVPIHNGEFMVRWANAGSAKAAAGILLLCLAGLTAFPRSIAAQTTSTQRPTDTVFSLTTTGLVSIQPGDGAYVGWPYLDKPLGGVGPGFAVGLSLIERRGFAVAAELSTQAIQIGLGQHLFRVGAGVRIRMN
jgi:hypothetical protein